MSLDISIGFNVDTGNGHHYFPVFEAQLSHIYVNFAKEHNAYNILWHAPHGTIAKDMIEPLEKIVNCIATVDAYDYFFDTCSRMLTACKLFPKAEFSTRY